MLKNLISEIHSLANPERAKISQRFFKTGKGEYGEGDVFLGLTVPQTRGLVKKYAHEMTIDDIDVLLADKHHEIRLAGVLILVYFAQKKKYPLKELARFYMQHVSGINNWDLIDTSSEHIIGLYIQHELSHEKRVDFITQCIASSNLWINRIIILASFHQIKQGNGKLTIYIAERFLQKDWEMCKNEHEKERVFEAKGAY
jgi:3-methyladenine DNA glycosylase AlkD